MGGSQGAEIFGTIIPPVIKMIKDKGHGIEIIQQYCCLGNPKLMEFLVEKFIQYKMLVVTLIGMIVNFENQL